MIAVAAHALLGYGWTAAGLLGAALAPTDPAMVFAVLRGRSLSGRPRTLLEGEAGFNDPAGIALMLGLIELATHDDADLRRGGRRHLRPADGARARCSGSRAACVLRRVARPLSRCCAVGRARTASPPLLGGSGFLAVFVAGLAAATPRRAAAGRGRRDRWCSSCSA